MVKPAAKPRYSLWRREHVLDDFSCLARLCGGAPCELWRLRFRRGKDHANRTIAARQQPCLIDGHRHYSKPTPRRGASRDAYQYASSRLRARLLRGCPSAAMDSCTSTVACSRYGDDLAGDRDGRMATPAPRPKLDPPGRCIAACALQACRCTPVSRVSSVCPARISDDIACMTSLFDAGWVRAGGAAVRDGGCRGGGDAGNAAEGR